MSQDTRAVHIGSLFLAIALAACSSSGGNDSGTTGTSDTGTTGNPDAGAQDSGSTPADVGPRDVGPRADAGQPHYCAVNNEIQVGGTRVMITPASAQATANGAAANTACIDKRPTPGGFTAPIFVRGCLNIMAPQGTTTSPADLAALDVAVFFAQDPNTHANVDPSWDRATGMDKSPANRIPVRFSRDQAACPSGVQLTIGFQLQLTNSLQSETEYIVRARTSTMAGTPPNVWATTYYYGIIVRNDNVAGAGGQLAACTPEQCFLRHNFNIFRSAQLLALAQAAGTPIGTDLSNGVGAGYALIESYDCSDTGMKSAVGGFGPTPLSQKYLSSTGAVIANATSSDDSGLVLALGFTGQTDTSSAALGVTAAVGIERDGTCTEEFGGRAFTVFPDSVSVMRTSAETALHNRP